MNDNLLPRITAAAIRLVSGEIVTQPPPARHWNLLSEIRDRNLDHVGSEQGFIMEPGGRFLNRKQAYGIAKKAGQLLYDPNDPPLGVTPTPGVLYSEDVW